VWVGTSLRSWIKEVRVRVIAKRKQKGGGLRFLSLNRDWIGPDCKSAKIPSVPSGWEGT